MKAERNVKCSRVVINVQMAHGHDPIIEQPMHGESQACVNTAVLLLSLLPPRPQLLLSQCAGIKTKLPLTAVPAYPLAKKNGRLGNDGDHRGLNHQIAKSSVL